MKHVPLEEFFDKKLAQMGPPLDPLEMGVTPPRRYGLIDVAAMRREIRATRRKVNRLLKKYEGVE